MYGVPGDATQRQLGAQSCSINLYIEACRLDDINQQAPICNIPNEQSVSLNALRES